MHHGGALGEVGAEADPIRVRDAHAGGNDVVDHAGELVDAEHGEVRAVRPRAQADVAEGVQGDRPEGGPRHVRQQPEDPVEVQAAGLREPVGEQVQSQVGICRVDGRGVQVGDVDTQRAHLDAADLVGADARVDARHVEGGAAQRRRREPGV